MNATFRMPEGSLVEAIERLAQEAGLTYEQYLAQLREATPGPDCLVAEEFDLVEQGHLPQPRADHLDGCAKCRKLFEASRPRSEDARTIAVQAVQLLKTQAAKTSAP